MNTVSYWGAYSFTFFSMFFTESTPENVRENISLINIPPSENISPSENMPPENIPPSENISPSENMPPENIPPSENIPSLPDLVPYITSEGVCFKNAGSRSVSGPIDEKWLLNGKLWREGHAEVDDLAPGETFFVCSLSTLLSGILTFIVDPYDRIAESNEMNNELTIHIPENVSPENAQPENAIPSEIWFADISPPLITIFSPLPIEYYSDESLTIDFKATDFESDLALVQAILDGVPVFDGQEINLGTLGLGQHTLTVSAADKAGNESTEFVVFTVVEPENIETLPDTFPPLVMIIFPFPFEYWTDESIRIAFDAADLESGIASIQVTLDDVPVSNGQRVDLDDLGPGEHTLVVTAIDRAGNKSTDSVTFTVVELPTFPEEKSVVEELKERIQKLEGRLAMVENMAKQISQLQQKVEELQAKLAQQEEIKLKIEKLENTMVELGGMENRILELERAVQKGTVGGAVSFIGAGTEAVTYTPQVTILAVMENENNRLVVMVSSEVPKGKTIVINVENWIIPIRELGELLVTYDGKPIGLADNYSDVLDPTDENVPEYLAVLEKEGLQILVSVPKFSTHEIVITKKAVPESVAVGIPTVFTLILILGVITVIGMILRKAWRIRG